MGTINRCNHATTYEAIDVANVYYTYCATCPETWINATWDEGQAAAFRTAIELGRSWETAMRIAREYQGGYGLKEPHVRARHTPANKRPSTS